MQSHDYKAKTGKTGWEVVRTDSWCSADQGGGSAQRRFLCLVGHFWTVGDEPTAAMDARAEAEVFEHFRRLASDRITILISHRFSTVRMADQIAVLERGRIVELGSHQQLMERSDVYAGLFSLQAQGYR